MRLIVQIHRPLPKIGFLVIAQQSGPLAGRGPAVNDPGFQPVSVAILVNHPQLVSVRVPPIPAMRQLQGPHQPLKTRPIFNPGPGHPLAKLFQRQGLSIQKMLQPMPGFVRKGQRNHDHLFPADFIGPMKQLAQLHPPPLLDLLGTDRARPNAAADGQPTKMGGIKFSGL